MNITKGIPGTIRLIFLMSFLLVLTTGIVWAQGSLVRGTVTDEGGEPIPGASVLVKGTSIGVAADIDGRFSIEVPSNATLIFSFIGMVAREVQVGNQTVIDISLKEDISTLDEYVVVGYASIERRDLTSSVSSVNAKQLADIPINSAAEALAGRLAGVQVTGSEGSPNAEVQIRVRGGGSITQDNSPLYVVDGVQVENALSVLSPQDIESIDVLKDASATAIYGARGANGVVIITTKGGSEMKTTVSYNGFGGVKQLARRLEVMNPYEFVRYQHERSRGSEQERNNFLNTYGNFGDINNYRQVPFVDWQDEIFGRNAIMQTHNVSVAGGTAATKYNLSVTSNTEEGVMLASDFDRKLLNFRFDHKVNEKLSVGFNVRHNSTTVNGAGTASEGSSSTNRLRHAVKYRPLLMEGGDLTAFDPDYADETNANSLALINPILLTDAEYRQRKQSVTNFSGSVNYKINDHFSFRTTLGIDFSDIKDYAFNDTITSPARQVGAGQPIASIRRNERMIVNNSNVFSFSTAKMKTAFTEKNKFDVLIGHEIFEEEFRIDYLESRFFPIGITAERALGNLSLGTPQIPTSNQQEAKLVSFFGRVNYAFGDKFLFAATMRADGSSKFAPGRKWGYFPSFSGAYRISDEPFMMSVNNTISDLKIRASYGESGNNRIDNFLYLTQFGPNAFYGFNNQVDVGFSPVSLANENLIWETTVAKNIGLDAGLWGGRIQLSVDAYINNTRDLLVEVPVPSTSGYVVQIQNVGETSNKGIEVQLSGAIINKKDFNWTSSFNISHNVNRVESLGEQSQFLVPSGWAGGNVPFDYAIQVGKPVGTMWGLVTDGFYQISDFDYNDGVYTLRDGVPNNQGITSVVPRPGTIKFQDLNGDGVVDDNDRTAIGNATPRFFGGLNQQFTFKNFDASIFLNFVFGNDILNANKLEFSSGYTPNSNLLAIMNDRFTNVNEAGQVVTDPVALAELNADAKIWTPLTSASSFYMHSWAVEDGSFLRINNVTLGYTLPARLLQQYKIQRMRFYATGNNLAIFTKYTGYDPEVNTRRRTPMTPGVDYSAYPRARTFIAGVNITF
ncbi:TonB-dependent receptor [Belliella sp. DSM 111904]|uniref:TonB-dependent receptor n=1 Tax=Belliella filtrata TaxID=2923435 RepID=A0ABS9UW59_9BACT|nr:TonB-dependent receptor [Belliella filtrata]MCH7408402.1 TonB-dependent receptor [Belliella filtrata]